MAEDHRPRVAAERRERMHRHLLECATVVFARSGITVGAIQEVVKTAEVSHATFYNYFSTSEELFQAVALALSNEIVDMIESAIGGIDDPTLRIATAIRSYLRVMRTYPVAARFIAGAGLRLANELNAIYKYLPRDLAERQKRGCRPAISASAAIDVIGGIGIMAVHRIANGRTPSNYPEQIVQAIMRALGLSDSEANRLIAKTLPKIVAPSDSLLVRSRDRCSAQ